MAPGPVLLPGTRDGQATTPRAARERWLARLFFSAALVLLVAMPLASADARRRRELAGRIPATHLPAQARHHYALLVVFQPRDCESYRGFIAAMGGLASKGAGPVVGIPVNTPRGEQALDLSSRRLAPEFPLAPAAGPDAIRLLRVLGYTDTPVAILVDPIGRPVLVVEPQAVPYRQAQVSELVEKYLLLVQRDTIR